MKKDIPKEEQTYFDVFYNMVLKLHALGYIKKEDMKEAKDEFDVCLKKIEKECDEHNYDKAREIMGDYLMHLQLKRSIGGFTPK